LVSVPAVVGVTTIVIVALWPPARLPTLQLTVPFFVLGVVLVERVQLPCVVETESKWALAGRGSVTVTPVAVCPPLLVAVIV
jgi:hypothetical protein